MNEFTKSLRLEVQKEIDRLERTEENIIKKSLEASHILGSAFNRLKEFVSKKGFKSEAEEIEFFKEIKPRLCSKLIYYRKVYNIEMLRPAACVKAQIEFLNDELESINRYTSRRLDFIRYYRSGATWLDSIYFTREKNDTEQYLESFYYELDPHYSTNCDFKVARIMANDMLTAYLLSEIEALEYEGRKCGFEPFAMQRLTWQGSKSDLIELIYSFVSKGCFGNVPLSQVASYFEYVFNIRLDSNISRAFSDMKIRSNPTQFLDELKEALEKKILELEKPWEKKIHRLTLYVYNKTGSLIMFKNLTTAEINSLNGMVYLPESISGEECSIYALANYEIPAVVGVSSIRQIEETTAVEMQLYNRRVRCASSHDVL